MTEQPTTPPPAPQDPPAAPPEGEGQGGDELSPEAMRKALEKARQDAARYRTRVRELEPKAAKVDELENAGKSDLERLTARAETAERERTALHLRSMRIEVAFEKGLTPAQAKRLVGATREELEADADEVLRDFPVKPQRPAGDIGQGPRGPKSPAPTDAAGRIAAGLAEHMKS